MIRARPFALGALALVAAAVLVVAGGTRPDERAAARSADWQRLVHGLGLGPALDLSDPAPAFDPRVAGVRLDRLVPHVADPSLGRRAGRADGPP